MTKPAESSARHRPQHIHQGPWSAELRGDELAEIRYGGHPVIRGIRAVVRNHNWRTLTPAVTILKSEADNETHTLRLDIRWEGFGSTYQGTLVFHLEDQGLTVDFKGTAVEDFRANRIGLIVLHRPDETGRPIAVTSPQGETSHMAFPRQISPHQPFMNIAALAWEHHSVLYRLSFEGDIFETEDQRNWTDASFKTYSTPLSKPFPVLHTPGQETHQILRLTATVQTDIHEDTVGNVPQLGTAADTAIPSHNGTPLNPDLGPLLTEITLGPDPALATVSVEEAVRLAELHEAGLDARIVAKNAEEVRSIMQALPLHRLHRLGVFSTTTHVTEPDLWEALNQEATERRFRGVLLAGARSHFTELNRTTDRLPSTAAAITYSITSQMHAVEPEAVAETVPMQTLTLVKAQEIGQGKPLHLGPITIEPRFNAVATEPPDAAELRAQHPLECTPFAAAWLLGSIAALTRPGVASLSYTTVGALDTPAGRLLQQLAALHGFDVLKVSGTRDGFIAYPVRTPEGVQCFAANLAPWTVQATFRYRHKVSNPFALAPWSARMIPIDDSHSSN